MYKKGRFLLLGGLICIPFLALGAEKIVISPALQDIVLMPGQNLAGEVEIQNQTSTSQQFQVRSVSFDALDTSGGVAFLGSDINNEDLPPANFIFFENNNITVLPGETKKFSFQIQDQESLSPGGHYAAIIFQSLPVTDENAPQKIAFRQIFSSLIFLEKTGGAIKELQLKEFGDISNKNFVWMLPKQLDLLFVNTGNTHVVPRGRVEIQGFIGNPKACSILNESSSILLPNQERIISAPLTCKTLIPGLTTIKVSYRHDGKDELVVAERTLIYIPYQFLIFCGAGAILLLVFRVKVASFIKKKP